VGPTDIYVAGTGVCLPPTVTVDTAVQQGWYNPRWAARTEQQAVAITDPHRPAPDLAVTAARQALEHSGHAPADVRLLVYLVSLHTDLYAWSSAGYIANQLDIPPGRTLFFEQRCGCDGLVGPEIAYSYLQAQPEHAVAVLAAADTWPAPLVDRWRTDSELPMADGGAAIVLSRQPGLARIAAISTTSDPVLEGLQRGTEPFQPLHLGTQRPIDLNQRVHAHLDAAGLSKDALHRRREDIIRDAVDQAMADAGIRVSDLAHIILPFVGAHVLKREWLKWLGVDIDKTSFRFSRTVGHLGPSDPFAGLHDAARTQQLKAGDQVLMLMDGAGYICTALVLDWQ
jgi:3-oxoacyl-[acyl-carrier-protein] synthase III